MWNPSWYLPIDIKKILFSACYCNEEGSSGENSDFNGKCDCKDEFDGLKCEKKVTKQGMV